MGEEGRVGDGVSGEDQLREGDSGLGRRVARPEGSRLLSAAEQEAPDPGGPAGEEPRAGGLRLPGFLFDATFVLAVAALGAVLLLFVLAQAAALAERLAAAPPWLRYPGLAAVGLLLVVVVLAAVRLAWLYLRVGHTGQVDVRALADLAERQTMRRLAQGRLAAAGARLRRYLEGYPVEGASAARGLMAAGFAGGEIERLRSHRRVLLDPDLDPGAETWLRDFEGSFQAVLDAAAQRRVREAARWVGVKTAVTPRLVDTAIVLHAALRLVGDLCRIYQLRPGAMGTAVVLGRAFVLAYLSSHIQQASEDLTRDAAAQGVGQLLEGLPEGVGQVGSRLAGVLAPKMAEGAANGILLWRLGTAAIRLLRPVAV